MDRGSLRRSVARGAAFVLAVSVAARLGVPVPGSPVPQSLQTLAIVLGAALAGWRVAVGAMLVYLALGALGVPVFADGAAGVSHLAGPTAGYLAGFVAAAGLVGLAADRGLCRRLPSGLVAAFGGHVVILALGWAWLARTLGPGAAFDGGVAPFLWGGAVKSAIAAIAVVLASGIGHGRRAPA